MEWDLVQWPAMAMTVFAAWLLTSTTKRRRCVGFLCFLFRSGFKTFQNPLLLRPALVGCGG